MHAMRLGPAALAHCLSRAVMVGLAGAVVLGGVTAPSPADAQVQPYGTDNVCCFRDILPPGTNGLVDATQLAAWETTKARPPHNDDQVAMYAKLTTAVPNITEAEIPEYFKDATFGVPPGDVAPGTESPEPGVVIERDSQYGVPHIYGDTRAELMFGIGYASAEDRLFMMDVLRHAGEGKLAEFVGGSNVAMDESVWATEPYTEQDLEEQVNYIANGPDGHQIISDATNYVDGINAYIAKAKNPLYTLSLMPAEYPALGMPQGPAPFTLEDLVSIATLIGGIFGDGGGDQLSNAILYENLERRFGPELRPVPGSPEVPLAQVARSSKQDRDLSGFATFLSFVDPDDPEAPTTVHGKSFPYQTLPVPSQAERKTIALPDPGSVQFANHVAAGAIPQEADEPTAAEERMDGGLGDALGAIANAGPGLLAFPKTMSNALLISAADSTSGHPLAVMGPQIGYFAPGILMEEDIHGPGIDAEGASFPGVNMYVDLGHGTDYAWSATSGNQNITDTFAVALCDPAGGKPSIDSNYYLLKGRCTEMQSLTDHESWQPNLADSTPRGSITLVTQRTAYGIVIARATIHGRPVIYCNLRSTYMHELDSIVGVERLNEPGQIRGVQGFFNAAYHIGYTFNFFYADDKHIAYFNAGLNPVRAPHTDPLFPSWASFTWRGYHPSAQLTPTSLTEDQTAENAHPHVVDQPFITSWNNKQAPGYNDAATGQEYSSVHRSQLLDNNIEHYLDGGKHKMTLADLINAMGNAGTQDLRGVEVLPYALKIIGHPKAGALKTAVSELRHWVATGAHRINRQHPGASGDYDQTDAIRIMDAWWPLWVKAEFQPVLGPSLLSQVESDFPINDEPGHGTGGSHVGSAFIVGFYGIVQKDLRAVLGEHVRGGLNRTFCGDGSLARCRTALEASLLQAASETPDQVYPADSVCKAGDQMCSDSIQFRAIGVISQPLMEWINRPTFQQADEIMGSVPPP